MVGVLHPQDVCVVLKCIVGVFCRPLGVVMSPPCVCSLSPSLYLSISDCLAVENCPQVVLIRECAADRVATKEKSEHCLERHTSPLLQTEYFGGLLFVLRS